MSHSYQLMREAVLDIIEPTFKADWGEPAMQNVANEILAIPRIAQALKLMDDIDAGVVELITMGSRPESSDAR